MLIRNTLISLALISLTGCDQVNQKLGIEDPDKKEARQEAEGKAVGSACRHSGRAIEDCYAIYSWLPKAPVFSGWREMDTYMRENQIETIAPQLPPPDSPSAARKKKKAASEAETEIVVEKKPAPAPAEPVKEPEKAAAKP